MILSRHFIISGLFCLTSCSVFSPEAHFVPEEAELSSAEVGASYFHKVEIIGGRVIGGWYRQEPDYIPGVVTPTDAGIYLRNCRLEDKGEEKSFPKEPLFNGNCIEIYGTPIKPGVVKINISGGMYGNMFVPAGNFSKDYTLQVVAP